MAFLASMKLDIFGVSWQGIPEKNPQIRKDSASRKFGVRLTAQAHKNLTHVAAHPESVFFCSMLLSGAAVCLPMSSLVEARRSILVHTVDGRNPAPLGNHEQPLFVGVYRESLFQGVLGGAGFRPSTVPPQTTWSSWVCVQVG